MNNVVMFANKWHERNPEGLSVSPLEAHRFINILTKGDFCVLAQDFETDHQDAWFFISCFPNTKGYFDAYKLGKNLGLSKRTVVDSLERAEEYGMIERSPRPELKNWIILTKYGHLVKNAHKNKSRNLNRTG